MTRRSADFESAASASSAIPARLKHWIDSRLVEEQGIGNANGTYLRIATVAQPDEYAGS